MYIHRCPRCRAEDISADAHPTRILDSGRGRPVMVCRNCYRAAELEFRIACQASGLGYVPLETREALVLLRDFYRARIAEYERPEVLMDETERFATTRRIRDALETVERRLADGPTDVA